MAQTIFIISISFLAYTYAVYPLIILGWRIFAPRRVEARYSHRPVSVVLVVRNDEDFIEERLRNILSQDYPRDLLEVVLVPDGTTDRTLEVARSTGGSRVRILETGPIAGRADAINRGVAAAANDIVVFGEVRQRFGESAIAELTAMFHDRAVGAVSGQLIVRLGSDSDMREGVGAYWKYERALRSLESRVDSVVGATRAIYAIRRELFSPIPAATIIDNFLIPMRVILRGYRVIFVPRAKAYDWRAESRTREFRRKARTLAGHFQVIVSERSLLDPRLNPVFLQMVSHRLTRLFVPYFLVAALVSNAFLFDPFYRVTLFIQLLFYGTILLAFTPLASSRVAGLIRAVRTFAVLNAAAVMGLWVYLLRPAQNDTQRRKR
ncbi:MAG: glycosyltransferase [bacterium]|nr:glycosyltransferase [bacterium]